MIELRSLAAYRLDVHRVEVLGRFARGVAVFERAVTATSNFAARASSITNVEKPGGRCNGVAFKAIHMPCMSGWPLSRRGGLYDRSFAAAAQLSRSNSMKVD